MFSCGVCGGALNTMHITERKVEEAPLVQDIFSPLIQMPSTLDVMIILLYLNSFPRNKPTMLVIAYDAMFRYMLMPVKVKNSFGLDFKHSQWYLLANYTIVNCMH